MKQFPAVMEPIGLGTDICTAMQSCQIDVMRTEKK